MLHLKTWGVGSICFVIFTHFSLSSNFNFLDFPLPPVISSECCNFFPLASKQITWVQLYKAPRKAFLPVTGHFMLLSNLSSVSQVANKEWIPRLAIGFGQTVHLPVFNKRKRRKWYFMWTLFYPKKRNQTPQTHKRKDTKEHTWNDEKEQWYCTISGFSSQVLFHGIRYEWSQQNTLSR